MEGKRMTYGESRLMNLIWEFSPISSTKLTELCRKELGWKKSTSYTMRRDGQLPAGQQQRLLPG